MMGGRVKTHEQLSCRMLLIQLLISLYKVLLVC